MMHRMFPSLVTFMNDLVCFLFKHFNWIDAHLFEYIYKKKMFFMPFQTYCVHFIFMHLEDLTKGTTCKWTFIMVTSYDFLIGHMALLFSFTT